MSPHFVHIVRLSEGRLSELSENISVMNYFYQVPIAVNIQSIDSEGPRKHSHLLLNYQNLRRVSFCSTNFPSCDNYNLQNQNDEQSLIYRYITVLYSINIMYCMTHKYCNIIESLLFMQQIESKSRKAQNLLSMKNRVMTTMPSLSQNLLSCNTDK